MQHVIITCHKIKYLITNEEYAALKQAISNGSKSVMIQGQIVSLSIHPSVIPLDKWLEEEKERLVIHGLTRCKRCYNQKPISNRCICRDRENIKTCFNNPIKVPKLVESK